MFQRLHLKHIPGLDGVRAISVALVMLFHFGFLQVPGGHGVLIFFVLSGFLITWMLMREEEATGRVSLRGFYVRRAVRILPAFYGFMIVALSLLIATNRRIVWAQTAATALYVANYYGAVHDEAQLNRVFAHIWSLAVEEQFYVLWPLAFIGLRRNTARMAKVLAAAILFVWVYRAALAFRGVEAKYIYHAFDTRADHLLVGCLAAVVLKRGDLTGFWRAVTRSPWMLLLSAAAFGCSAVYGNEHLLYRHTIGYALDPVLAAIAIVQAVVLSATPPLRWLNWAPVQWVGRVSYSLYLYQQLGVSRFVLPGRSTPVRFAVCMTVTFALAAASHYLIERPFLKLRHRPGHAIALAAPTTAPDPT